ncbi:serine--tRNA ligase [Paenibacillus sp. GCM10027626]|uniref:serine--tRNA ligase n=1 Tax=Paenibacillus sp. GCM10027626 TaxID=3273411 RepID=UPI00362F2AFC
MLDIKVIRERAQEVQQAARQKGLEFNVEQLLAADAKRRQLVVEVETMRAERNRHSAAITKLLRAGKQEEFEREKQLAALRGEQLKGLEEQLRQTDEVFDALMLQVPNLVSPDTPVGTSDADNVEVRRWGEAVQQPFQMLDHVELGERHGLMDLQRGVKIGGSRHYVLQNNGQLLHRAVQQLALDLLADRGYRLLDVPMMVKEQALTATGFFPANRDQTFAIAGEDSFLAGTSEVPLVALYSDEVIDLSEPLRLAAATPCFRSEVGSAGRDVHGLYRVHQFAKVEQVVICQADAELSEQLLQQMVANAEQLLQLLELPYRVVAVCTGDMSQKTYKQYDIETWMPSRGSYGETHSASNIHEFQARRARIRYRDDAGNLQYAHTLNNTMVASPRILIPLLENHQQADGTIYIPPALRPYMRGQKALQP